MLFLSIISFLAVSTQAVPLLPRQWSNSTLAGTNTTLPSQLFPNSSLPAQLNQNNWDIREAIGQDFPDPAIIKQGNTWYAFSTASNGVNTQVATSPDFNTWTVLQGHDALPVPGAWVASGQAGAWAPDVFKNVSILKSFAIDSMELTNLRTRASISCTTVELRLPHQLIIVSALPDLTRSLAHTLATPTLLSAPWHRVAQSTQHISATTMEHGTWSTRSVQVDMIQLNKADESLRSTATASVTVDHATTE